VLSVLLTMQAHVHVRVRARVGSALADGPFSDAATMRSNGLVGVSLYTPRLNEIVYPQQRWTPDRVTASPAFLLQVRARRTFERIGQAASLLNARSNVWNL
jgi:hypothetical protein